MIALAGNFFVVAFTAAVAAATLRLERFVGFALAAYLFAWTELVLLGEALSAVRSVGRVGYAAGEALLLVAALAAWRLRGRPRPPRPVLPVGALRRHPLLVALAVAVCAAFAYQAFIVVETPPNNFDSMTYHLSRAAA